MIEVKISCQNVHDDFGLMFAADPESAAEYIKSIGINRAVVVTQPFLDELFRMFVSPEVRRGDVVANYNEDLNLFS